MLKPAQILTYKNFFCQVWKDDGYGGQVWVDNPDYLPPQGDDEPEDYSDDFSPRTESSIRKREAGLLPQSQTPCDRCGEYTKGPYIKDVRKIFGLLNPLPPPLVQILG